MTSTATRSVAVAGPAERRTGASPRARRGRGVRNRLLQLAAAIVLFGSWELFAATGITDEKFTSRPTAFVVEFVETLLAGGYWALLGLTLFEVFVGFVLAVALGLALGFAIAESRMLDTVLRPFLVGFNNIPRIALAPLFVLWFGLGSTSRIVLVVSMAAFIVAFSTKAGMQAANRDHLLLAKTLGASRVERFVRFVLPAALPSIFSGVQLALTYSFMGAVAGEMLSGNKGIGGMLALSMNSFDTDGFFAALLLLVIVSLSASAALDLLERRLLAWRRIEMRGLGES